MVLWYYQTQLNARQRLYYAAIRYFLIVPIPNLMEKCDSWNILIELVKTIVNVKNKLVNALNISRTLKQFDFAIKYV